MKLCLCNRLPRARSRIGRGTFWGVEAVICLNYIVGLVFLFHKKCHDRAEGCVLAWFGNNSLFNLKLWVFLDVWWSLRRLFACWCKVETLHGGRNLRKGEVDAWPDGCVKLWLPSLCLLQSHLNRGCQTKRQEEAGYQNEKCLIVIEAVAIQDTFTKCRPERVVFGGFKSQSSDLKQKPRVVRAKEFVRGASAFVPKECEDKRVKNWRLGRMCRKFVLFDILL